MNHAFYYEDTYYLLPDAFSDYQSLIDALQKGPLPMVLHAVALREDHAISGSGVTKGRSMAPYFLSGYHDTPDTVTITNAEDVYPAYVEVYSQEAYNAKLRETILKICPGCLRYKVLSNRDQSLNGHFEEMGLDGVCLFRQETKPAPRNFHHHLFSFGGFYMRFNYYANSSSEMMENLSQHFYTKYTDSEIWETNGHKTLMLTCRKNEILLPLITDAICQYISGITKDRYRIQLSEPILDKNAWLAAILSQNIWEKDCKKYGVSIGVLEYAPEAAEKIRRSLKPLLEHFWMFPIWQEDGKEAYLLADTSYVLKELRYRSPLLQTFCTQMDVYSQYGHKQYKISFDMPYIEK